MTRKKRGSYTLPDDKKVISGKSKLGGFIDQAIKGNIAATGIRTKPTIKDKLDLIKDELLKAKDQNIPYTVLHQFIKESTGINCSVHALRTYCQKELGFPVRAKKA